MNKILIALYVACAAASTAYVISIARDSQAPIIVADASHEPT